MNWILNLAQEKRCGTHLDTVVKPLWCHWVTANRHQRTGMK